MESFIILENVDKSTSHFRGHFLLKIPPFPLAALRKISLCAAFFYFHELLYFRA